MIFYLMWMVVGGFIVDEANSRRAINVVLLVGLNEVLSGREVEDRTAKTECF